MVGNEGICSHPNSYLQLAFWEMECVSDFDQLRKSCPVFMRSGQSLYEGNFHKSPKEWTMNGKIRLLRWVQVPQRGFGGGSWVRTSQAQMPWPGVVFMKIKPQKGWGSPHLSQQKPQSHWGNPFCVSECAFPSPHGPSAGCHWIKSLGSALLNSRFHLYQSFPHVPALKYVTWLKYSNQSVPCQTTHLHQWSQTGLLFGSNLSLFCNKTVCL